MTGRGRTRRDPPRLVRARPWLAGAAAAALAAWTLLLVAAATPGQAPGGAAGWFAARSSLPAAAGYTALLAAVLVAAVRGWLPRQRRPVARPPLVVAAVLAGLALLLGMSVHVRCTGGELPVLSPLAWTLSMVAGDLSGSAPALSPCAADPPLALQLARLFGLLAVFVGAVGTALVLFRGPWSAWRMSWGTDAVVFVGMDAAALPLALAELGRARAEGRGAYVVAELDGAVAGRLAELGVSVVSPAAGVDRLLGALLHVRWRWARQRRVVRRLRGRDHPLPRIGVAAVYLVDPATWRNLDVLHRLRDRLDALAAAAPVRDGGRVPLRRPTHALSVVVRVDGTEDHDRLWRESLYRGRLATWWRVDYVSPADAAAQRIVTGLQLHCEDAGHVRPVVVVDGDGPLAEAVVQHLDLAARLDAAEARDLGTAPAFWPSVVVAGRYRDAQVGLATRCWEASGHVRVTAARGAGAAGPAGPGPAGPGPAGPGSAAAGALRPWELDPQELLRDAAAPAPGPGGAGTGAAVPVFAVLTGCGSGARHEGRWAAAALGAERAYVAVPPGQGSRAAGAPWGPRLVEAELSLTEPADQRAFVLTTWSLLEKGLSRRYQRRIEGAQGPAASRAAIDAQNGRGLLQVTARMRDVGYLWGPAHADPLGVLCTCPAATCPAGPGTPQGHDPGCPLLRILVAEHEDWRAGKEEQGFVPCAQTGDRHGHDAGHGADACPGASNPRQPCEGPGHFVVTYQDRRAEPAVHDWLVPWDRLAGVRGGHEAMRRTLETVADTVALMHVIGFSPWRQVPGDVRGGAGPGGAGPGEGHPVLDGWRAVRRRSDRTAVALWRTEAPGRVVARAPDGRTWEVPDAERGDYEELVDPV